MGWILVQTLLSLTAVIGLMVGTVMVMKRFMFHGKPGATSIVPIDVVGQTSLHPKRSIVVLKVVNKLLVVGMSEQGMQTLSEISDPASLAEVEQRMEARPTESRWITWRSPRPETSTVSGASFASHLTRYVQQFMQGRTSGVEEHEEVSWSAPRRPTGRRAKKRQ